MKRALLLGAGFLSALTGFVATGYWLMHRMDPETGEYMWAIPRDAIYQWHTALGGILLAAAVAFFLPLDWKSLANPKTPNERIAAVSCLTILWVIVIYAMARH